MSNLFEKAKPAAKPEAAKKSTQKVEVEMSGVRRLAALNAAIEALTALRDTTDGELKTASFNQFITLGSNGVRPASFEAIDGTAKASMQLKTRSSASGFTDEEVELLKQNGITPHKNVAVAQMFGINTKYGSDEKLLAKVSKAIEKIVPADFIVMQEEKSKLVSSDAIVSAAFKDKKPAEVIKVLTTQAIRATLGVEADVAAIMEEFTKEIRKANESADANLMDALKASIKK